jgi:hypothetical protein
MESGGDQAMGTPGKKKGGPPPADTACQWSTEDRSLMQEIPPFNTSTVGRPDSPAWGAAHSNAISRAPEQSRGAIIGYPAGILKVGGIFVHKDDIGDY